MSVNLDSDVVPCGFSNKMRVVGYWLPEKNKFPQKIYNTLIVSDKKMIYSRCSLDSAATHKSMDSFSRMDDLYLGC